MHWESLTWGYRISFSAHRCSTPHKGYSAPRVHHPPQACVGRSPTIGGVITPEGVASTCQIAVRFFSHSSSVREEFTAQVRHALVHWMSQRAPDDLVHLVIQRLTGVANFGYLFHVGGV